MKRTIVGLSAIALASVSACSAGSTTTSADTSDKTATASASSSKTESDTGGSKDVTIVAAFSPLAFLAAQIGGDHAEVINLTKPGTSPHDVEIEPKTMAKIAKSDAFFYLGGKFQTTVDKVAEGEAKKVAFDIADAADLQKSEHGDDHDDHDKDEKKSKDDDHDHDDHDKDEKKSTSTSTKDDDHDHDHDKDDKKSKDDDHDHDDHDKDEKKSTSTSTKDDDHDDHDKDEKKDDHDKDEHGHGHDHGGLDPHFWLDPVRMVSVAEAMTKHMVKVDADHADEYKANGKKVVKALNELNESFETKLKPCKNRTIVSGHETYLYMAKRYDLKQLGISGLSPDSEPKPKEMVKISKFIKKNKITTIYADKAASPDLAKTLAKETGAKMAVLNETGTTGNGNDYINAMEETLATLVKHQDCK